MWGTLGMGGSGPAHAADPALGHRMDVAVLGAGQTLLPCSAQSWKGLNTEISKSSVTAILPLPPQPHTPASRKLSQGGACKARGGQAGVPCTGGHSQHSRPWRSHTDTCTSLQLRVINYLLQPPLKTCEPCVPCPPNSLIPTRSWEQHSRDLGFSMSINSLASGFGAIVVLHWRFAAAKDCRGILLTSSSSD